MCMYFFYVQLSHNSHTKLHISHCSLDISESVVFYQILPTDVLECRVSMYACTYMYNMLNTDLQARLVSMNQPLPTAIEW